RPNKFSDPVLELCGGESERKSWKKTECKEMGEEKFHTTGRGLEMQERKKGPVDPTCKSSGEKMNREVDCDEVNWEREGLRPDRRTGSHDRLVTSLHKFSICLLTYEAMIFPALKAS